MEQGQEEEGGEMGLKKIMAFIDWLGGPDRKNGKTVWRKGHWRTYENGEKIYIRGTWIRRKKAQKEFQEIHSDFDLPERWQGQAGHS